jgi:hypothetical protein
VPPNQRKNSADFLNQDLEPEKSVQIQIQRQEPIISRTINLDRSPKEKIHSPVFFENSIRMRSGSIDSVSRLISPSEKKASTPSSRNF